MKKQLKEDWQKFMEHGAYAIPPGRAACAMRQARILAHWREAEAACLVRLRCEPEQESYFDVFGKPDTEKERKQMEATLERLGCWYIVAEVNDGSEAEGDDWRIVDAIGMCVYDNPLDPFENCYVPDLMKAALDAIPQPGNVDELCTAL